MHGALAQERDQQQQYHDDEDAGDGVHDQPGHCRNGIGIWIYHRSQKTSDATAISPEMTATAAAAACINAVTSDETIS